MTDTRYWSKDFISNLIEEYKSHPCLWKIGSKEYTNKHFKNKAYEKLVKLCKSVYPEANRDFVVKKIQSLRGSFRKEVKKVEESKRSVTSADDVYVPLLWYYDLLLFTKDQEIPTNSISNIEETDVKEQYSEQEIDVPRLKESGPPEARENVESTQITNTASTPMSQKKGIFHRGKKRLNTCTEVDTRYWSKDFMVNFIEEYKSHPCLWKIRSKEYTNKNLKNEAYEKLVKLCKSVYPEANRDFVVKKIQSLRGSFRKEVKKVEESERSGTAAKDIYVPSLWYYDLLLFTKDQEMPTNRRSNIEETDMEEQYSEQEVDVPCWEESGPPEAGENIESTQISNTVSTSTSQTKGIFHRGKKRLNTCTETRKFFDLHKTVLGSQTVSVPVTEFDAVGVSIAKKLQRMHPTQAIFAESIINQIVTRGLLSTLTDKTKLCDESYRQSSLSPCYTSSTSRPPSTFSYNSGDISQSSVEQA